MATNEELRGSLRASKWNGHNIVIGSDIADTFHAWFGKHKFDYFKYKMGSIIWEQLSLKARCILLILQDRGVL